MGFDLPDGAFGIPFVFVFGLLIFAAIAVCLKKRWKMAWTIYALGLIQQILNIASLIFFSPGGTGSGGLFLAGRSAALRELLAVWRDTGSRAVFVTPGRMLSALILSAVIAVAAVISAIQLKPDKGQQNVEQRGGVR